MEILPNIHRVAIGKPNIKGLYPPNVYMILGERVAIIDTGYNQKRDHGYIFLTQMTRTLKQMR